MMSNNQGQAKGYVYTAQAFVSWGFLAVYWKLLSHVPALEILSHRIFWSFLFVLMFLALRKKLNLKQIFRTKKSFLTLIVTGLLVGSNWGIYIYGVNSGHIVETSLGYYITPLVNVVLGMVFLKEKLSKLQILALLLAVGTVGYLTIDYGRFPWIAIYLAFSFGLYGLLKKKSGVEPMSALAIETMVLTPFALVYIIGSIIDGSGHLFTGTLQTNVLFIVAGVVTTLPLYWFAQGTKRIPLTSIGFMQYIAPTIMLLLGIFLYHEGFPIEKQIAFASIWLALVFYSIAVISKFRKRHKSQ